MLDKDWKKFQKFVFFVFLTTFVFLVPMIFAFAGNSQQAGLICIFSIVFILLLNIDKVEVIKLWGLEAQLREVISEANVTIDQLKDVACAVSKATLTDMMAGNFFDGMSLSVRLDLHDNIVQALKKIGLSEEEISIAKEDWDKGIAITYHRGIRSTMFGRVPGSEDEDLYKERSQFMEEYNHMLNFKEWLAPSPEKIESFAKEKNFKLDKETRNLIEDYKVFMKSKKIPNREIFANL